MTTASALPGVGQLYSSLLDGLRGIEYSSYHDRSPQAIPVGTEVTITLVLDQVDPRLEYSRTLLSLAQHHQSLAHEMAEFLDNILGEINNKREWDSALPRIKQDLVKLENVHRSLAGAQKLWNLTQMINSGRQSSGRQSLINRQEKGQTLRQIKLSDRQSNILELLFLLVDKNNENNIPITLITENRSVEIKRARLETIRWGIIKKILKKLRRKQQSVCLRQAVLLDSQKINTDAQERLSQQQAKMKAPVLSPRLLTVELGWRSRSGSLEQTTLQVELDGGQAARISMNVGDKQVFLPMSDPFREGYSVGVFCG